MEQSPANSVTPFDGKTAAKAGFKTSQGVDVEANVIRMSPQVIAFEAADPNVTFRISEALTEFRIFAGGNPIYSGNAIVTGVVHTGTGTICEATLKDLNLEWQMFDSGDPAKVLRPAYEEFTTAWKSQARVLPEYKVLAADLQTFLNDLRVWTEQLELGIRSSPSTDRSELERRVGEELYRLVTPTLDSLFDKFEHLASKIEEPLRPLHQAYIKRLLHPLLLCSPFAFRSIQKPLGYAGDYEIVNMILRNSQEGASLFGKVLNLWFVRQPPAEAHRNRIVWLKERIVEETARVAARGQVARIYNLGSGPAREVQDFMLDSRLADQAHFTLLDFNEETLAYARAALADAKSQSGRRTKVDFIKKSVAQVLRAKDRRTEGPGLQRYDFVYCAGLFDYLSDTICKQLMNVLYDLVAPGGLLVSTNVDSANPIRHWLGDILEWHLIYRNGRQFATFRPDQAPPDEITIRSDLTGVNIFLMVRKPAA